MSLNEAPVSLIVTKGKLVPQAGKCTCFRQCFLALCVWLSLDREMSDMETAGQCPVTGFLTIARPCHLTFQAEGRGSWQETEWPETGARGFRPFLYIGSRKAIEGRTAKLALLATLLAKNPFSPL